MEKLQKVSEKNTILTDKVDKIINVLIKHAENYGSLSNFDEIDSIIELIIKYQIGLENGLSNASTFMTLGQMEALIQDLRKQINDVNFKAFVEQMRCVKAEAEIVSQKKNEYLQQEVKLRNHCRCSTSVMSLVGRVNYERMSLIPSRPCDKEKLKNLRKTRYIYPLDEALGLDRLPFKMTLGVMLAVAKESIRCESFEEAQKILEERNIIINDDTMRQVTNVIGGIVFNNDVKAADAVWTELQKGTLTLPSSKDQGVLYLEVDGAMLPTRQDGQKGTIYKENKLGMVFSDDNIYRWKDKHGNQQHKILKREYTALIGDNENFQKLLFNLALKNGYGCYKNTVIISDGATWIRNMKDLLFPDSQQILDFYHLKEHIFDYYKKLFDFDESKYLDISKKVCSLFYESKITEALNLLKISEGKRDTILLEQLLQYINNNLDNIDYAKYKAKGYFIGSGAIESSNKTVLQSRLKYGAMRWHVASAQSIVTLVTKTRSQLWESDVVEPVHHHYRQPYPVIPLPHKGL
jgi:hypothetical protein